jgi:HAD superfamily hydrolase (TIGR01509 family)
MEIRCVFFDMGGVLVRTTNIHYRKSWAEALGMSIDELIRTIFDSELSKRGEIGQITEAEVWSEIAKQLGLPLVQIESFRKEFWAGDELNEELIDFILSLHRCCKVAILSNAWTEARDVYNREYHIENFVDKVIISSEEKVAKPDPGIYKIALRSLNVCADQAIFIDDRPSNVAGASLVGMHSILFENNTATIAAIRQLIPSISTA